jgi:aldehyde dehydrogenase (NAD+)
MAELNDYGQLIADQRKFFNSGATLPLRFRLNQLQKLYNMLADNEADLAAAAHRDFGKPTFETIAHEVEITKEEIRYLSRRLPRLIRPIHKSTPLHGFPSRNLQLYRPFGVSIIIGAWNYPILLVMLPLTGSIAAGNCAVLKPSEMAPSVSKVVRDLIGRTFEPEYLTVVEGGAEESRALLREKPDKIFFTGSPKVGKVIMESAARHLTPVTLELGGKSPCIVEQDADIDLAAKRIAWGKFINAGQTCVCPDYIYVHESVEQDLIEGMVSSIHKFYGDDPLSSPDYVQIINGHHLERLSKLIDSGKVVYGGVVDRQARKIGPTIMNGISWGDPSMQEEIFGPILPVLKYSNLDEVEHVLQTKPVPLALYLFTASRHTRKRVIERFRFGGCAINDVVLQYGMSQLPVGGVGESGVGRYHGEESFKAFSYLKGIMKNSTWFDLKFRYPPYKNNLKWIRWVFRL